MLSIDDLNAIRGELMALGLQRQLDLRAPGGAEVDRHSFRRCDPCGGLGFVARGDTLLYRSFDRCCICGGVGQHYLAPSGQ